MTHTQTQRLLLACIMTLCLFLVVSVRANAEDEATSSPGDSLRDQMEERRGEMQDRMEERRTEIASSSEEFKERMQEHRASLAKKMQERLYNLTENIRGRMGAASFRLSNIADRLESRTQKLKDERGIDDGVVREALAKARTSLADVDGILANDVGTFAYDTNPRESFKATRDELARAREALRAAHEALREALAALKDAVSSGDGSGVSDAVRHNDAASTTNEN